MRKHPRLALLALLLLAVASLVGYGLLAARADPLVRHLRFVSGRIAPGTPPFRVVLISDIHIGNRATPVWRLERVVDQVNALQPDAIIFAGDLVNGYKPGDDDFRPDLAIAPLARLHARLGVWAVLGNHDDGEGIRDVKRVFARAHVRLLDDAAARIGPIALSGVRLDHVVHARMAQIAAQVRPLGGLPVLVVHAPPDPWAVPATFGLVLAGHTHCGQIVLPGWDNSFDPFEWQQRWAPQWRCGLVRARHYALVVTAGIGAASQVPLRIGAPSDIWEITLVPAVNAPKGR